MISTKSTITTSNNPPWYLEDDDSIDDDWFYASIKRYQQLSMFHLSYDIQSLDVLSHSNLLVVAGKFDLEQIELAVYQIPEKLIATCPLKEGLLHQRDFSFVAGARASSRDPVIQVKAVNGHGPLKIILLQKLRISSWKQKEQTDLLIQSHGLHLNRKPDFMKISKDMVVICEGTSVSILNISEFQLLHKLTLSSNVTGCDFDHKLTVCLSNGSISVFDIDSMKESTLRSVSKFISDIKCSSIKKSGPYQVACISESGQLAFFGNDDSGDLASFVPDMNDPLLNASVLRWCDNETIMVANMSQVIIFGVESSKLTKIFVHDAHKSFVSDCIPHPNMPKLIFSSDSRNRLHAWLYRDRKSVV